MRPRSAAAWLLLSAAAVTVVRLLGPAALPAVYDGLPVPADRYRYVDPPAGVRNGGPPLRAHGQIQLIGGGNSAIDVPTGEYPPQAELQLFHGDIDGNVPGVPVVATAEVTITPVRPPPVPLPAGEQLHGNVYLLRVVAAGHSLGLSPNPKALISLRQPRSSSADPTIAVLDHGHWRLLDAHPASAAGTLEAPLPALGYVTLVERTSGRTPSHHHTGVVLAASLATLVLAGIVLIRLSRRRRLLNVVVDAEDRQVEANDHRPDDATKDGNHQWLDE